MTRQEPYDLRYDAQAQEHVRALDAHERTALRQAIEASLRFEPATVARNRKPLRRTARWAGAWELRCGARNELRVFYRVDEPGRRVLVLAVGVKDRSALRIGGEEFQP
jgi:mRNA-degrading endonuclease RelE of RelBE toxin-antitoxin system